MRFRWLKSDSQVISVKLGMHFKTQEAVPNLANRRTTLNAPESYIPAPDFLQQPTA